MRKLLIGLACLVHLTCAQTTLRLRYGGPQSSYRVTAISNGLPAVVTVNDQESVAEHSLVAGDQIYLHLVAGCPEANGYRKVALSPAPTTSTFALTDLSGNPIQCSVPFDSLWQSGYVGKFETATLNSHPRLMAPHSGALYSRMIDPDGSGPGVAAMASENGPAWQSLVNRYASGWTTPGCDGVTKSLCPTEESQVPNENVTNGWDELGLALVWQADNTKTGHLHAAEYFINNAERVLGHPTGTGFPCDLSAMFCGAGSYSDWISASVVQILKAYDIIRSQLTPAQRQRFTNVILNGYNGSGCTNQLTLQPGTVNVSGATVIGSGGLSGIFQPGDWIYFKTPIAFGPNGVWSQISTVTDTVLTLTASAGVTVNAVPYFSIAPWDQASSCGALYLAGGHPYFDGNVSASASTKLAGAITSSATVITVVQAGNFPDPAPFIVFIDNEAVQVTSVSGSNLTVVRGQLYSNAGSHNNNVPVTWYRQSKGVGGAPVGPMSYSGDWRHNLDHQKTIGYVMAGLALADEDPRGITLAESAWNGYYDLSYPWMSDFWSGPPSGGMVNFGYAWGRWQQNDLNVLIAGQYAFSDTAFPELNGDYFWRGLMTPIYWSRPSTNFQNGLQLGGESYGLEKYNMAWFALGSVFYPGTSSDYTNYWWRSFMNAVDSSEAGQRAAVWIAPYYNQSASGTNFTAADPWSIETATDWGPNRSLGLVLSRTDWTPNSTLLAASLGYFEVADHNVDQSMATTPGAYVIEKGSKILIGGDDGSGLGVGSGTATGHFNIASPAGANYRQGSQPWWATGLSYDGDGGPQAVVDQQLGTSTYVWARGNMSNAYRTSANVTRSLRSVLHLKGPNDYVVVYDDHAASQPDVMSVNFFYYKADDPATNFTFNSANNTAVSIKATDAAQMISTQFLFPAAVPSIAQSTTPYTNKLAFTFGTVPFAQMIAVHRLASGTTDVLASTTIPSTDTHSTGVQIDDGNNSWGIVLAADGMNRTDRTISTAFTGKGQILFTGLSPDKYWVFQDGNQSLSNLTVGADGTLLFTASGPHTFRVVSAANVPHVVTGLVSVHGTTVIH